MIEVLRLGHRPFRDKRISTHVALVARAFGAFKLYYSGHKDDILEKNILKVVDNFGGEFKIEYIKDYLGFIENKKKKGFLVVHLTMYGLEIDKEIGKLRDDNVLLIVGGEKVPKEIYDLADFNISVGNQPHSEVAALAIFLDRFFSRKELTKEFNNFKVKVLPCEKGKKTIKG